MHVLVHHSLMSFLAMVCLHVLQSETATKILKIFKKSDTLQSYVNKTTWMEMAYFNVVAAEGDRWFRLRVSMYEVQHGERTNVLQTC